MNCIDVFRRDDHRLVVVDDVMSAENSALRLCKLYRVACSIDVVLTWLDLSAWVVVAYKDLTPRLLSLTIRLYQVHFIK